MADDDLFFGQRLRIAMARKNVSTADMMRELDVSRAMVSQMCLGQKFCSSSKLLAICKYLDVSLDWLMEGKPVELVAAPRPPKVHEIFY